MLSVGRTVEGLYFYTLALDEPTVHTNVLK